jgi:hypothetical protein
MRGLATRPRQRSTIDASERSSVAAASPSALVSLFGRTCAGNCRNFIRVGSATPSPKAKASPVPSDGRKARKFAAVSATAQRSSAWSRSLVMRMANSVEHCDRIVESSSAGRCVTRPRNTPYLRPSLAMREMARRVGAKPTL